MSSAERPASYLNRPAIIDPAMTDEEWAALIKRIKDDDEISDEGYEKERETIYGGLLPIGCKDARSFTPSF